MMRGNKIRQLIIICAGGGALFSAHALYSGNAKFYRNVAMPAIHKFTSAENAHNLGIYSAKHGIYPKCKTDKFENLGTNVFGKHFENPIGLAAGFDKHCEAIDGLLNFGFGFIEVGGVTPEPQPGNDKPRVFRLQSDKAIINRYGFNSVGHKVAGERVKQWFEKREQSEESVGIVGVNLGKNKTTEDPAVDYVRGVHVFGPIADFLVINVSSPNTPGLRKLQGQEQLKAILSAAVDAREKLGRENKPAILVKIAPDLTEKDMIDIASVVAARGSGVDGLIISNTTLERPDWLTSENKLETGGLSGAPLRDMSTNVIRNMYKLTSGRLTIIGVGGVFTGQDALDKIKAGASLVQIYSSLAYRGPPVVHEIKQELSALLEKQGYTSVSQAVGADIHGKRSDIAQATASA